jgi:hypothetical protein
VPSSCVQPIAASIGTFGGSRRSGAGNDPFDCRQGQAELSGDLGELDPGLACRTNGANLSWGKTFRHVFGLASRNGPTTAGVFRSLF